MSITKSVYESLMKNVVALAKRFEQSPTPAMREVVTEMRRGVGDVLERVMAAEIELFLGRGEEPGNKRNGFVSRAYGIKGVGTVKLRVPRDRAVPARVSGPYRSIFIFALSIRSRIGDQRPVARDWRDDRSAGLEAEGARISELEAQVAAKNARIVVLDARRPGRDADGARRSADEAGRREVDPVELAASNI